MAYIILLHTIYSEGLIKTFFAIVVCIVIAFIVAYSYYFVTYYVLHIIDVGAVFRNSMNDYLSIPQRQYNDAGISFSCPSNWVLVKDNSDGNLIMCIKFRLEKLGKNEASTAAMINWRFGDQDLDNLNFDIPNQTILSIENATFNKYSSKHIVWQEVLNGNTELDDVSYFNCNNKILTVIFMDLKSNADTNSQQFDDIKQSFRCN